MNDSLDQDSTFFQEIETNRAICINCYRRLKTFSTPHSELPDCVSEYAEYEDHVTKSWFDDYAFSGNPSVKRSYCECGVVDDSKIRPIKTEDIMDFAVRVRERLEEEGVEVDDDTFFDAVRENRGNPDMQFNEEKIFEKAIERAKK